MLNALLDITLPVFLVIAAGYFAAKLKIFTENAVDGLMSFAQQFAIPCLLFKAIAGLELGTYFEPRLLTSYFVPVLLVFALGLLSARVLFKRPWEDSVAIGMACMFANTVLLGLPITERAYGPDALDPNYAIVAVNAAVCFAVGITAMELCRNRGKAPMVALRAVINGISHNSLIIGIALGFAVNLSNIQIPSVAQDALDLIVRAALPTAIFALGGVLAQYKFEGDLGVIATICFITLVVHPVLVFGMSKAMALNIDATRSAVVTAAMAPGANAYVFASMYGVAKRVSASSVLAATALSILSVTVWLNVLP